MRYKGQLTREQIMTARNKALINATKLLEDAQILFDSGRYSRAYFLLCICNEELGKSIFVISSIVEFVEGNISWDTFWRTFRNHKDKRGVLEYMENFMLSTEENFTPLNQIREMLPEREEFKMASLYCDMFQNDFFEPDDIFDELITRRILDLTKKRLDFVKSIPISNRSLAVVTDQNIKDSKKALMDMMSVETV